MKIGLGFITQIRGGEETGENEQPKTIGGWIALQLTSMAAKIATAYHTEHNDDDSHKTIHASGAIYERNRVVALGDWTEIGFNALNYSGAASMTWTVASNQQIALSYRRTGNTLVLSYWIEGSTVGGTPATVLKLTIPANLHADRAAAAPMHYTNAGASSSGFATVSAGDTFVSLMTNTSAAWAAGALSVQGQIEIPITETVPSGGATSPILTYTGVASGAVNFGAVTLANFTTVGTYSITVNKAMTLTLKGSAGGGGGGGSSANTGAGGGGGAESLTAGLAVSLATGKTYTLIVGALGAKGAATPTNGSLGGTTSFVNTTDTVTLLSLTGGGGGTQGNLGGAAGAGGTGGTGAGRVAGGIGGNGSAVGGGQNGTAAASGCGGGAGAGFSPANGNGGTGGNGSATGGAAGTGGGAGGNNGGLAGDGGSASGTAGGGGGGGGSTFSGLSGAYGGGGGGGAGVGASAGGNGLPGVAQFTFVSAP